MQQAEQILKRLEWTVIRRLDGLLQGDYRTLFRGGGLDLADLREYQFHDDVRHIDWNVTARLQAPHVRQYTEDRELGAWFLLDTSASLDFGSQTLRKRDVLVGFVGVLARLLTRHGNKVGALVYSQQLDALLPLRSGRLHVLRLLHQLLPQAKPKPSKQPTQLSHLLTAALGTIKRRSLVFVVSDFISQPGWEKALGQLALQHEVIAVRLADPAENALPDLGMLSLTDPETGEALLVDTSNPKLRMRFEELAAQRQADLQGIFIRAGVDALDLLTTEPLVEAIMRFAQQRKQRARCAAGSTSYAAAGSTSHAAAGSATPMRRFV